MAVNYKNKNAIRDDLELLGIGLNSNKDRVGENENSKKKYKDMLDRHFYENLLGDHSNQSARDVMTEKALRALQEVETKQMLGLNFMSAAVGLGDSLLRQI